MVKRRVMRKTLQDVANYLNEIMVPETIEKYEINSIYTNVLIEDDIYQGVGAFRDFLSNLYEVLSIHGLAYDNCKKIAHEYENRTTLSVYYPFLDYVSNLLINIGYQGVFSDDKQCFICKNTIFNHKISIQKTRECLAFLILCGIEFEGLDLNKKLDLSTIDSIKISYTKNPNMLLGLKIMAIAERDHRTLVNQDVFLRCDYRVLKSDGADVFSILQDTIKPLDRDVQNFVVQLHNRYISKGLSCIVETKGYHIYIKYGYKRKDVWGINASLNNGYHINVKSTKTNEYEEVIKTFSPFLQELIEKGYGCGRKREIGHCDGGCRGITIPLNQSVLDIQDEIIQWFDLEIAFLSRK